MPHNHRLIGDGGRGICPSKFGKIFFGKYHVKIGNFVNFIGQKCFPEVDTAHAYAHNCLEKLSG